MDTILADLVARFKMTLPDAYIERAEKHGDQDLHDAMCEFPIEERSVINRSKLGWILKKNANRIVSGLEIQKGSADGRPAWRVVTVTPPSPPLPALPVPVELEDDVDDEIPY